MKLDIEAIGNDIDKGIEVLERHQAEMKRKAGIGIKTRPREVRPLYTRNVVLLDIAVFELSKAKQAIARIGYDDED